MLNSLLIYTGCLIIPTFLAYLIHTELVNEIPGFRIISKQSNKRKLFVYSALISIIPVIIIGLRSNVGTDYSSYQNIAHIYSSKSPLQIIFSKDRFEIGFKLLIVIAKSMNFSEIGLNLIFLSSLIFYYISIYTLLSYKNRKFTFLSIFIFLVLFIGPSSNIIRQCMAVSFIFFSFKYIERKQLFKYTLLVLLATTFHYYAIICLPLYFLKDSNSNFFIKKKEYITVFIFLIPLLVALMIYFINNALGFNSDIFTLKNFDISWLSVIIRLPILVPFLWFRRDLIKRNRNMEFYYYVYLLEIIAIILGFITPWGFRLMYYFLVAEPIIASNIIYVISSKKRRKCMIIYFFSYYIAYFILEYAILGLDGIFPYQFVFGS